MNTGSYNTYSGSIFNYSDVIDAMSGEDINWTEVDYSGSYWASENYFGTDQGSNYMSAIDKFSEHINPDNSLWFTEHKESWAGSADDQTNSPTPWNPGGNEIITNGSSHSVMDIFGYQNQYGAGDMLQASSDSSFKQVTLSQTGFDIYTATNDSSFVQNDFVGNGVRGTIIEASNFSASSDQYCYNQPVGMDASGMGR